MPFGWGVPKVDLPDAPSTKGLEQFKIHGVGKMQQRRELEELIRRVELIQEDCITDNRQEELAEIKDDFLRLKRGMYNDLLETKELIRERHDIQQLRGNTVEAIQKAAKVNERLISLDQDFLKIKDIFKKQTKQRKTIGDDELDKRFKDMQILKRQIEECRALFRSAAQFSEDEIRTLTDFRAQMRQEGVDIPPPQEQRELMGIEKDAMARWAARDQKVDAELEEVGQAVDRLGDIAIKIGEKADRQGKIAVELTRQADEASEELVNINTRIKDVMMKGNGVNFFCKLLLALILVGELGYILSKITA